MMDSRGLSGSSLLMMVTMATVAIRGMALLQDPRYPKNIVTPGVKCMDEGVFPHPENCIWFVKCVDQLGLGLGFWKYYFQCAPGTVFADGPDQCVHSSNTDIPCVACLQEHCETYQLCAGGQHYTRVLCSCYTKPDGGFTLCPSVSQLYDKNLGQCVPAPVESDICPTRCQKEMCDHHNVCQGNQSSTTELCSCFWDDSGNLRSADDYCDLGQLYNKDDKACVTQISGEGETCSEYDLCIAGQRETRLLCTSFCDGGVLQSAEKMCGSDADQYDKALGKCVPDSHLCLAQCAEETCDQLDYCRGNQSSTNLLCSCFVDAQGNLRSADDYCGPGQLSNKDENTCVTPISGSGEVCSQYDLCTKGEHKIGRLCSFFCEDGSLQTSQTRCNSTLALYDKTSGQCVSDSDLCPPECKNETCDVLGFCTGNQFSNNHLCSCFWDELGNLRTAEDNCDAGQLYSKRDQTCVVPITGSGEVCSQYHLCRDGKHRTRRLCSFFCAEGRLQNSQTKCRNTLALYDTRREKCVPDTHLCPPECKEERCDNLNYCQGNQSSTNHLCSCFWDDKGKLRTAEDNCDDGQLYNKDNKTCVTPITGQGEICSEYDLCTAGQHKTQRLCSSFCEGGSLLTSQTKCGNELDLYDKARGQCISSSPSSCPDNYFQLGCQCFFINNVNELDWSAARAWCAAQGGDLAQPLNTERLIDEVRKVNKKEAFWLGGSDIDQEGVWVWVSGRPVDLTSDVWLRGEPNDHRGREDCLNIWKSKDKLNDSTCDFETKFVCEHPTI